MHVPMAHLALTDLLGSVVLVTGEVLCEDSQVAMAVRS
jgi:hypothetical protein